MQNQIQALESGKLDNISIKSLTNRLDSFITDQNDDTTLQRIPGHADIPGNKRADKLAKKGASCPQTDAAKQLIRCNKKETWMNEWTG